MPTRRATTSFSEQVLTNSRYFWRLSKKRKLREGAPSAPADFVSRRGMPVTRSSGISSRGAIGASTPWLVRKTLTRSKVSGVMRAPSLSRETNLPSLTARRPKVDSAMPARRQNSEMLSNSPTAACAIAVRSLECGCGPLLFGNLGACLVGEQPQKHDMAMWDESQYPSLVAHTQS